MKTSILPNQQAAQTYHMVRDLRTTEMAEALQQVFIAESYLRRALKAVNKAHALEKRPANRSRLANAAVLISNATRTLDGAE